MAQSLNRLKESASQTAGPYVHIGLTPNFAEIGGVPGRQVNKASFFASGNHADVEPDLALDGAHELCAVFRFAYSARGRRHDFVHAVRGGDAREF